MEQLIPVMNKIQDAVGSVNLGINLKLPQIAVVGGQSVGKSSILEGLVGRAFLPTGAGVVTRRPLMLRMRNTALSGSTKEIGEFAHLPGVQFEDFSKIRDEIVADTERVCGSITTISAEPIILTISSPKVLDLTLIDLPGITRVPVGDQPLDIEDQIRSMIMEFVANPNCLILAIAAGNADLATADALAIARRADPEGSRTIGVISKLDLVDSGVDLLGVLEGRVYPLKLGFIGVVCRSFRDVESKKALDEQLKTEAKFFRAHSAYGKIAERSGIGYLGKYLNMILLDHIYALFPEIQGQVQNLVQENEAELLGYGESLTLSKSEQGALLLSLFTKFAGRFGDATEGKIDGRQDMSNGQLIGRARIDYIFRDVFARTVTEFDPFAGLTDSEIRVAIQNATGPKAMLLIPEAAFEMLAKRQIDKLEAPSLQCAELVFEELQRVVQLAEVAEFRRYKNLREQIFCVCNTILRNCLEPTSRMIKDMILMELAYINTSHPDFIGSSGAMKAAGQQARAGAPSNAASPSGPRASSEEHAGRASNRRKSGSREEPAALTDGQASEAIKGQGFFSNLGFLLASKKAPEPSSGRRASEAPAPSAPSADAAVPSQRPRGSSGPSSLSKLEAVTEEGLPAGSNQGGSRLGYSASSPNIGGDGRPGSSRAAAAAAAASGSGASLVGENAWLPHTSSSSNASPLRLAQVPQAIMPAQAPPSQRERVEVDIIKNLLSNYLGIVKKNIADSVPKVVMCFMVNNVKDAIQRECVTRLYKEEMFDTLLEEGADVAGRRKRCHDRLQALYRVIEVFEQVRDMNL